MLYLIHGSDRPKILAKASELVENLKKRKPDASVFTMTDDDTSLSQLEELVSSQGLFENKYVVLLKNLFSRKDNVDALLELLPRVGSSENVFIFVEGILSKPVLKIFKECAEQIQEYSTDKKECKPAFNIFSLADALGARDRKTLWVMYQKAVRSEASPEELSGILFWQIKNLMLARQSASARAAGLNPFVFGKAKRFGRNFSQDELTKIASKLITLYHDAHRGLADFETGLERFVLNI